MSVGVLVVVTVCIMLVSSCILLVFDNRYKINKKNAYADIASKLGEIHRWCSYEFPDVGHVCYNLINYINGNPSQGVEALRETLRRNKK